jgi:hypothetical protein
MDVLNKKVWIPLKNEFLETQRDHSDLSHHLP